MGCGTCARGCGGGEAGVAVPAGLATEIVIADEREAQAVAEDPAPSRRWPGIQAGPIDQVKLARLWAILAGGSPGDPLIGQFTPLEEVSEDGPWVFRVPAPLAALLAGLAADRAARVAEAWACTEELELDDWRPEDVRALVDALRGVARAAAATRKPMLMWVSL